MAPKIYTDPEEQRREIGIDAPMENKSKVEQLKLDSKGLRGQVFEELHDESVPYVSHDSYQLMKHHGMYQQDNRDTRIERKRAGLEKDWSVMIRTKIPGGVASAEQYLAMDEMSDKFANGTLRLTTRQTIQFHGVLKGNLPDFVTELNRKVMTTYGACGDVVRNTMADPVFEISKNPIYSCAAEMMDLAKKISDRYLPKSCGYYDIFVNDENLTEELAPKATRDETEDLYGDTYMPRKFKVGLTVIENNSVDVFSQDLGIVAIKNDDGTLKGYNLLAGGGLGFSPNKKETFPRVADPICFVAPDDVMAAVHEVITIQRDYGNRADRKLARLKYVIHAFGVKWFKEEMERRLGKSLAAPVPIGEHEWGYDDHVGWHEQKDGRLYLGLFIENGRIQDTDDRPQRSRIREIVKKYNTEVRITPQQNMVLCNIKPEDKDAINAILEQGHISSGNGWLSTVRRNQMACVALPTCGLALAEAERVLPNLMEQLEKLGHGDEDIMIRMSGCPNSCSRAPMSEIGLIGRAPGKYNLYLGGDHEGTRTNSLYKETMKFEDIAPEISRLIKKWHAEKQDGEAFGDFCFRVGNEALAN